MRLNKYNYLITYKLVKKKKKLNNLNAKAQFNLSLVILIIGKFTSILIISKL